MKSIDGYIRNHPEDAKSVALAIREGPTFFSWTDGATHYDFWMLPSKDLHIVWEALGKIQCGLRHGMVLVAISQIGAFHFDLLSGTEKFSGKYVWEKLTLRGDYDQGATKTPNDIAELLTMISQASAKIRNIVV